MQPSRVSKRILFTRYTVGSKLQTFLPTYPMDPIPELEEFLEENGDEPDREETYDEPDMYANSLL